MTCQEGTNSIIQFKDYLQSFDSFCTHRNIAEAKAVKQKMNEEMQQYDILFWRKYEYKKAFRADLVDVNLELYKYNWPVRVTPDGSKLLALAGLHQLAVYDIKSGITSYLQVPHNSGFENQVGDCIQISPDSKKVLVKKVGEKDPRTAVTEINLIEFDLETGSSHDLEIEDDGYFDYCCYLGNDEYILARCMTERKASGMTHKIAKIYRAKKGEDPEFVCEVFDCSHVDSLQYQQRSGILATGIRDRGTTFNFLEISRESDMAASAQQTIPFGEGFLYLYDEEGIIVDLKKDRSCDIIYGMSQDELGKADHEIGDKKLVKSKYECMALSRSEESLLLAKDNGIISVISTHNFKKISEIDISGQLGDCTIKTMDITPDNTLLIGLSDGRVLFYGRKGEK